MKVRIIGLLLILLSLFGCATVPQAPYKEFATARQHLAEYAAREPAIEIDIATNHGGWHKNMDWAGWAALRSIPKHTHHEYSGVIFRDKLTGLYSYSTPMTNKDSVTVHLATETSNPNYVVVAYYHNHERLSSDFMCSDEGEEFSDVDVVGYVDNHRFGYLRTPRDIYRVFDPDKSHVFQDKTSYGSRLDLKLWNETHPKPHKHKDS